MKNNYILIDYENVQPKNLAILNGHPVKVIVFVGATQAKVPFDLASSLQALGNNAEYVKIGGNPTACGASCIAGYRCCITHST